MSRMGRLLKNNDIKRAVKNSNLLLVILILVIIMVFGRLSPQFLSAVNLVQYVNGGVVLGFLSLGLAASIITGNFDYSVGAMTGFGTVILALMMSKGVPMPLALPAGLTLMILLGVLNGFVVGYLRIPGMLGTLGTSSLIYGVSLVLTRGQAIGARNDAYLIFGKSDLGTVPFGMILFAAIFAVSRVFLNHSEAGRKIYLVGESPNAARFAGISYAKYVMLAHVYSALMCFCGAVILGSKMASGRADIADTYVLQAVTACVFGGISIKGGKGSIFGVIFGVIIFTLLTSGFTMIDVSQYYRQVVTGILLIGVLFLKNWKIIFGR